MMTSLSMILLSQEFFTVTSQSQDESAKVDSLVSLSSFQRSLVIYACPRFTPLRSLVCGVAYRFLSLPVTRRIVKQIYDSQFLKVCSL